MLDGLLGRNGFSSKCKSLIKPTSARIEVLRRRAEAKQRFLKEDLAKLLANGLDINAYGRTEEFVAGLNLLSCYNFIEQSCEYILKQLSIMQKQGQCPEECRETVASLMFAAARFSDLPELRDLRDVFQERYGNGLECFVNQVFVEKLASKPLLMEKRVKLLQDIAAEFSIQWDSEGFKRRMDKPSTFAQDQAKKLGPSSVTDDKHKLPNGKNAFPESDFRSKERIKHAYDGQTLHNGGNINVTRREVVEIPIVGREEKHGYKHEACSNKAETIMNGENDGHFFRTRRESPSQKHGSSIGMNDTPMMMKSSGSSSRDRRPEVFGDGRVSEGRKEKHGYKQEPLTSRAETIETRDNDDRLLRARQEFTAKKHGSSIGTDNRDRRLETRDDRVTPFLKGEKPDLLYHGKSEGVSNGARLPVNGDRKDVLNVNGHVYQQNGIKSTGKVQEEETVRSKPCYSNSLPPPYVKSNMPPPYSKPKGKVPKHTILDSDDAIADPSSRIGANVHSDRIHKKQDSPYHEHGARGSSADPSPHDGSNTDRIKKEPDHGLGEDHYYQNDIPLPKPRSVRRKHSKSSSSHDDAGSSEDARIVRRISSSRRKERKGLQILFDDEHYHRDEEEKMMDKLLLHYSKKPSAYDIGKLRKKKSRSNTSESPRHRSKDKVDDEEEIIAPPTRSISLPHEHSGESEPKKVYARANSFQPDNQARHVHPKLPDYDDLAARFAALRGR